MPQQLPEDYLVSNGSTRQGAAFVSWENTSYLVLRILPYLEGRRWDELALAYVHSVRPSQVRVLKPSQGVQLDAELWRVTVWLREDDITIDHIEQEVEVGLPDACANGAAVEDAFRFGLDSPQVKWHAIAGDTFYAEGQMWKVDDAGTRHDYPPPDTPPGGSDATSE